MSLKRILEERIRFDFLTRSSDSLMEAALILGVGTEPVEVTSNNLCKEEDRLELLMIQQLKKRRLSGKPSQVVILATSSPRHHEFTQFLARKEWQDVPVTIVYFDHNRPRGHHRVNTKAEKDRLKEEIRKEKRESNAFKRLRKRPNVQLSTFHDPDNDWAWRELGLTIPAQNLHADSDPILDTFRKSGQATEYIVKDVYVVAHVADDKQMFPIIARNMEHEFCAEKHFIWQLRRLLSQGFVPTAVTIWINFSPCHQCSKLLLEELNKDTIVRIRYKHLYKSDDKDTMDGLQKLVDKFERAGKGVSVCSQMTDKDMTALEPLLQLRRYLPLVPSLPCKPTVMCDR